MIGELYDEANDESLYEDGAVSDNLLDEIEEGETADASMLQILRESLRLLEPNRSPIMFEYRGIRRMAVPIKEMNSDKYIFNDVSRGAMFSAVLSEIDVCE